MGIMDDLDTYIKRAEEEELEKAMRPEAVEALKTAAKTVAFGYSSLEECLMGVEIYEEAKKHYFDEDDEFPLKYVSAMKSIVMMAEIEKDTEEEVSNGPAQPPKESPRTIKKPGKKRPSRRRVKIAKELKEFVKQAEEQELEKEMRDEGVKALKIAAYKLAYKKKYYDMDRNRFKIFPSVAALLVGFEIYEEAEKHYYDPEDEYPLKYKVALKEVAIAYGGLDEDLEEMELLSVDIKSDDDLFNLKAKHRSVKERRSVFESAPIRRGSSMGSNIGDIAQHHPLVSPPMGRRKKVTNHAFNQRMSMYTQRDDERMLKLKKLESMRRLNKKGVETVEKGFVDLLSGQFNEQVKEHEESFKKEIQDIQERKKRLREHKGKIRERKRYHRRQSEVKVHVQNMAKKNKLLASIEDYKGGDGVDVWSNVRATTIDVDHTTYKAPKNLPEPSPQEESLLVEAMEHSVLFHPHRTIKSTQSALVHAFEKFEIQEGEEFIQTPEDNFFYVVKEGSVDFHSNGKVVGTAKEGEHFGELNLLYAGDPNAPQYKRKFNLVARENSTLMRLNQAVFREILQVQKKLEEDVKKDYLKKVPFLRNLLFDGEVEKNKQTTSTLLSIMITKKFKEGEKILDDGSDPEDSLFIIKEGKVQLTSDKKEMFHLAAGSYIGKRALMASKGKEPNVQDLEGLSDGTLYQIEKDAVNKVLGQNFFARQFDVAQDKKKLEGFQCIKSVNLDPEIMDEITKNIEDKKFEEGKQILEEGADTEPCLYLVREGFVTLSTNNGEFKQKVGPGGYFGVEQLLVPKDKSKPAQASKKVLVPAQWSVSVSGDTPCVCGVLPLQDVQNALDGDSGLDLEDRFNSVGMDVILQPDAEDPMKPLQRMPSELSRPKITSAVETPEGQLIIKERLERRDTVKKSAPKLDNLEMLSVLGDGEFGEVWLVSAAGHSFALKMQQKKDEDTMEAIDREIDVTQALCHPNIVDLVTTYDADQSIYMLLGLVPGGELWELIYREDDDGNWSSGLAEPKARFYALVIADTLSWLHSEKYLYRDLKPENVMIDADGYPVLVDFGFAKRNEDDLTFTFCGTPNYVAPEIVQNLGHNAGADHWALGVLIYEMLSGEHPFFAEGMHQMQVFEAICQDTHYPLQTDVSEAAKSLIDGLLEKDSTQRLGMLAGKQNDILEHDWFSGVDLYDLRSRKVEAPWIPKKK